MNPFYIACCFIILGSLPAQAQETFSHTEAGVDITIPAGWYYEHGESDFTVYTPGKEVGITLAVIEGTEIDQAVEAVDADLEKNFQNVKLGEATMAEANGMSCVEIDGTATLDGEPVVIYYCLVVTPTGKILEISAVGTPAEFDKYAQEIEQLDNSLKPTE
ncbi:MAG: hypothetical protein WC824_13140 [Bacteroidota bacterium]|jgi:hypothetical protein